MIAMSGSHRDGGATRAAADHLFDTDDPSVGASEPDLWAPGSCHLQEQVSLVLLCLSGRHLLFLGIALVALDYLLSLVPLGRATRREIYWLISVIGIRRLACGLANREPLGSRARSKELSLSYLTSVNARSRQSRTVTASACAVTRRGPFDPARPAR